MKFGGSSVDGAERIRTVARIVAERIGERPVAVVSAFAGVTDLLEQALELATRGDVDGLEPLLAELDRRHRWALSGCLESADRRHTLSLELDRQLDDLRRRLRSIRILGEQTPRARDGVLACGEGLSARIVAAAFQDRGLPAEWVDPELVMLTDARHGAAEPLEEAVRQACAEHVTPLVRRGAVPVLGGFVGATSSGETTTLGRGGSDTSAAVLGLALEVREIQIWTDVDGLMTADPRRVPAARTLSRVSFAEAAELARCGARVLHPDAIAPAVRKQIPVRVLNTLCPSGEGTVVLEEGRLPQLGRAVALASRSDVTLLRVSNPRLRAAPDFPLQVLQACASRGIVPTLLLASEFVVTLVARSTPAIAELGVDLGDDAEVRVERSHALVSVVGAGVAEPGGLREQVLRELASWSPEVVAVGTSGASVSAVIDEAGLERCLRGLHEALLEGVGST